MTNAKRQKALSARSSIFRSRVTARPDALVAKKERGVAAGRETFAGRRTQGTGRRAQAQDAGHRIKGRTQDTGHKRQDTGQLARVRKNIIFQINQS